MHHLDLVAVRLFQPHPLAAAGLVDILHRRGAGRLGEAREVVLARGVVGKPDDLRLALLGDVDVMGRIGAAHIERGRRALRAHQAEAREELLHHIEVGCAKPPIGNVGRFDPRHSHLLVLFLESIAARLCPISRGPRSNNIEQSILKFCPGVRREVASRFHQGFVRRKALFMHDLSWLSLH